MSGRWTIGSAAIPRARVASQEAEIFADRNVARRARIAAAAPASRVGRSEVLVGGSWEDTGSQDPGVGASIWQTPGGVQSELNQINSDFLLFDHEIQAYLAAAPASDAQAKGVAILRDHVWAPLLSSWKRFYDDNKGWLDNLWWNHAPEAESFARQLVEVRASAKRMGMPILSPDPEKFGPSLLFDPGGKNLLDRAPDAIPDLAKILKVGLVVGLGVGGLILAMSLAGRARG